MTVYRLVNGEQVALTPEEVAALPPPPRLRLPRSLITARTSATGKFPAVFAYMLTQPALFACWFAADQPEVYADDADLHAALAGGGLTADEIAMVTAAP